MKFLIALALALLITILWQASATAGSAAPTGNHSTQAVAQAPGE